MLRSACSEETLVEASDDSGEQQSMGNANKPRTLGGAIRLAYCEEEQEETSSIEAIDGSCEEQSTSNANKSVSLGEATDDSCEQSMDDDDDAIKTECEDYAEAIGVFRGLKNNITIEP